MSKSRLFSGKIKKATGADLSDTRSEFIDVANAEPDLGIASSDNYLLVGNQDGTRTWTDPLGITVGNATNAVNTIISVPGDNSINIYTTGTTGTVTIALNTSTLMKTATTLVNNANVTLGNVTFTGNVVFNNTTTYVASTNTVYTDNIIEIHSSGTSVNNTWAFDDGKDIGFRFHYYNGGDRNAALVLANDTKYLEFYNTGTESITGAFISGSYGTFKTGSIKLAATTSTNSTNTGALTVAGGVGVGGSIYVGGVVTATTFIGALTGTASTATAAATAYALANTSTTFVGLAALATTATSAAVAYSLANTSTTFVGLAALATTATSAATAYSLANTGTTYVGRAVLADSATTATSAATAYSTVAAHTAGTGLSGSTFNGSTAQTWTLNTSTLMQNAVNLSGGTVNATTGQFSGRVVITNTSSTNSTQTGALVVTGGLAVGGGGYFGGIITATNISIGGASFDFTSLFNGFDSTDDVNVYGGNLNVSSATTTATISSAVWLGTLNRKTLTVTSITTGTIVKGMIVSGPGIISTSTAIQRQQSGSTGGIGNYELTVDNKTVISTISTYTGTIGAAQTTVFYGGGVTAYYVTATNINATNITAVNFTGNLTGNVTGNLSGNATTANGISGNQKANTFYAGPSSGKDNVASWRAIVAADVPTLNQDTTGVAADIAGGASNQILYQSAKDTTSYITAPNTAGTYLGWSGSAFAWSAPTFTLNSATATTLGGVRIGTGINITGTGVISLNTATLVAQSVNALTANTATNAAFAYSLAGGYVSSLAGGTGTNVSASNGSVTVWIGQDVSTSASPTFTTVTTNRISTTQAIFYITTATPSSIYIGSTTATVYVNGTLRGAQIFDAGSRVLTTATVTAGTGLTGGGSISGPSGNVTLTLNTATLMTQAVTALTATTATNAAFAYAFNTGTLITNAVNATTATSAATAYSLASGYVSSISAGSNIVVNTSTGAVTVSGNTASTSSNYVNLTVLSTFSATVIYSAANSVRFWTHSVTASTNWTPNITNLGLTNNQATTVRMVVTGGASDYNMLPPQIDGTTTGVTSYGFNLKASKTKTNLFVLDITRDNAGAYSIFGAITAY